MSLTYSFLRLAADVGTWSIHVVFLLVRFSAVAPFVWPLPDSLLVQWIKDCLRWSVASGGGHGGGSKEGVWGKHSPVWCFNCCLLSPPDVKKTSFFVFFNNEIFYSTLSSYYYVLYFRHYLKIGLHK